MGYMSLFALKTALQALGKGPKILGNCFAEYNTQHTTHGINLSANRSLPNVFYRALGKL